MGPQRSLHRVTWRAVAGLSHSELVRFFVAWLVSYTATNGLAVMFAVAMVRDYHTAASLPTTAYALGVGCSLLLYRVVGRWDLRVGPWRVLGAGLEIMRANAVDVAEISLAHQAASCFATLVRARSLICGPLRCGPSDVASG